jgi:hypothetical protein
LNILPASAQDDSIIRAVLAAQAGTSAASCLREAAMPHGADGHAARTFLAALAISIA